MAAAERPSVQPIVSHNVRILMAYRGVQQQGIGFVIGKGNKERLVSLPAALLLELQTGPFAARGYLFARMDGRPGPPSAVRVSERINDHLHALGIEGTAHALRHRFGTKLYEETTDPYLVADEMGHESINTTRGYVRLTQRANDAVEAISHLVA